MRSLHTAVIFLTHSTTATVKPTGYIHSPGRDGHDPEDYRTSACQNTLSKYNMVELVPRVVTDTKAAYGEVASLC